MIDSYFTAGQAPTTLPVTGHGGRFVMLSVTPSITMQQGQKLSVTATGTFGTSNLTGAGDLDLAICYQLMSTGQVYVGAQDYLGPFQIPANTVVPMTVSAVFPTFTGNVQVGLCYETGDTNWNKNGRMFVKTLQLR